MMLKQELKGYLFAIGAALFLALTAVFIRYTPVPIPTFVFARFALGTLVMLPFLARNGTKISKQGLRRHTFRSFLGFLGTGCFFYSVNHLSLMNAVTFSNTAPLFLPLAIFFILKEVIPKARFFSLVIGFIGVVVILHPSSHIKFIPALVALLGALSVAFFRVLTRKFSFDESTHSLLFHYFLISAVLSLFPAIYFWEPLDGWRIWVNLLFLSGISLLMQYMLTKALKLTYSTKVSAVGYLSVPIGGFFGWIFFGETPSFWILIGTVLIILGGVITILSKGDAQPNSEK